MPEFTLSRSQVLKARAVVGLAHPVLAALFRTWRWRAEGVQHIDEVVRAGRPPILAFWHGRILPATQYFRDRGIVVMASQNFDGEWIAGLIERFGYRTARGSTSRGGAKALVRLRRELADGHTVAFTIDGPRGPARVAQPGAVWLAGATGNPLVPFHIEADRYWTARSWDRTQVPRPFSTVAIAIGRPLRIDSTAADVVENGRRELEAALGGLEARAHALLQAAHSVEPA